MTARILSCLLLLLPVVATAQPYVTDPGLMVEEVAAGLARPTQLAFLGEDDFLVTEQKTGKVFRVQGGVKTLVLDVHVSTNFSDRGLLGLAVHPDFAGNGWVYLHYTESRTGADNATDPVNLGGNVYRYTWNGSALVAPQLLLSLPSDPGVFHSGGVLAFGGDGKLYTAIGDQQRNGRMQNVASGAAPDSTSIVVRLAEDGSVPPDNPFAAVPGMELVYAYGMRNVYGLDFDPVGGALWQTENGPTSMDELNRVDAGTNSGWLRLMGPAARDAQGTSDLWMAPGAQYSDPEFSWFTPLGVTAVHFLRSAALGTAYENDPLVADVVSGRIWRFELDGARQAPVFSSPSLADRVGDDESELAELLFAGGFAGITDLDTGPDGALYVTEIFAGKVHRVRKPAFDLVVPAGAVSTTCDASGEFCVSGEVLVSGSAIGATPPPVRVQFYLDDENQPANLLATFDTPGVVDGQWLRHDFCATWPDSNAHSIVMVVDPDGLIAEDREGNNRSSTVEECREYLVDAPAARGAQVRLGAASPNPFNPRTSIEFSLARAGGVRLEIYDAAGRSIRRLVDGWREAGDQAVVWDGLDAASVPVASGVYSYRIDALGETASRRMVLLR